ncbi:MAG TPA: metallophosphoesterase [Aliidongia sp.]|uniref:metallophosphoesterase family protein n=1 Tax=Aliidongia sp. TaxID=1914230 RepID=UPI002DDDB3FC|nr:metallophosphoesterase [Aliidongia sp.]HEV2675922.1 metallophosphoesterase [Aliidongia sp.]
MSSRAFTTGIGAGARRSHVPPAGGATFQTQSPRFVLPKYPFQPLPAPNGPAPYRYDLSQLLHADDVQKIVEAGVLVCHAVGDTGDYRGRQQDFVAAMMAADADALPDGRKPAFLYHLGDVIYFAGDIDKYGDNFYETYKDYPGFIVSIPGNHDCQPDDPQDGPVDPTKVPLDGWVQNFMTKDPGQLGSLKTSSGRTQLDLPNVFWTFTTPFATFLGLFSNVGEIEGEIHQDQIDWFRGELAAADPDLALIVAVHHPPYSGDTEHSGSSAVHQVLFDSFATVGRYPHLVLSGHVHNYQRFTTTVTGPQGAVQLPCVVAGAGGYTALGKLQKVRGAYPTTPLHIDPGLTLERYDQDNFGFLRLEISKSEIVGSYLSAPYAVGGTPDAKVLESFTIDLASRTVRTRG